MRWALPDFHIRLDRLATFENFTETDFLSQAEIHASKSPSAVLLSGGEQRSTHENRYSIAAWDPFLTLRSKGNLNRIETTGGSFEIDANPLRVLDRISESMHAHFDPAALPFSGGAVGYFAYDLKNSIENLPTSTVDDLDLPDLFVFWPAQIEVYDKKQRKLSRIALQVKGGNTPEESSPSPSSTRGGQGVLCGDSRPGEPTRVEMAPGWFEAGALQSNFTHEDYLAAVSRVRGYIRRGDVYQVNLSQRFQFSLKGDLFRLWKSLFDLNPAPFYAYINAGDHRILSTSMERFLYHKDGFIETRPIKGTRRRGHTRQEDEALIADLLNSPKDDAELSMIVDLLRNDLGRICSPGTVRVPAHKRLESYQNVHHLVSIVTGVLRPGISPGEIMRAAFPGGSITGCPKIRSMEIIDELEPNVRHVYTGAIGYIGWHGNLDFNVAIRTAIVKDEMCYFSIGGGIVYDSIEEDEYQETLDKGRTMFELVASLGSKP